MDGALADLHPENDLRIVHVNLHLREGLQQHLAQVRIDGLRGSRISLVDAAAHHLKGEIPVRIGVPYILHHLLLQFLEALILHAAEGADSHQAEYLLQVLDHLVEVKFFLRDGIDPSRLLGDGKLSVQRLQNPVDVGYQLILKNIAVFALDADLGILQ